MNRAILLAGILLSQQLVQDIVIELKKPSHTYDETASILGRINTEAMAQPPAQSQPPPPSDGKQ